MIGVLGSITSYLAVGLDLGSYHKRRYYDRRSGTMTSYLGAGMELGYIAGRG